MCMYKYMDIDESISFDDSPMDSYRLNIKLLIYINDKANSTSINGY
jgi:hypothetical protein